MLSDEWMAVLRVLDPDDLVDCGGIVLDEDERVFERYGWHARSWSDPSIMLFPGEALQYSALVAFGEGLRESDSDHFVVIPELDAGDEMYLPMAARFGNLNETPFKKGVHHLRPGLLKPDVQYSDFAQLETIDFSDQYEDLLTGRVPENTIKEHAGEPHKLIELTRLGLAITGPSRPSQSTPERPVSEDAFASRIVVTGDPRSVEDLALYWNLRAEHPFADPFPLWIPLGTLADDLGERIVEQATQLMDSQGREEPPWGATLQVLSASTHSARLKERLNGRYPHAKIGVELIQKVFTGEWNYYLAQEQAPGIFEKGSARIKRPSPEAFDSFIPTLDRAVTEVGVDGVWLPQSRTLLRRGIHGHMPGRITKRGTLEYLEYVGSRSPSSKLLNLQLPDGWTVLASLLADRGYECWPSAKSETALGQLSLLGDISHLAIMSSSKFHRMLRELSQRAAEDRGFLAERKTVDYNRFVNQWGKDAASRLVPWMIGKGLLFRGTEISCPKCRLKRWYEIDRIGHSWRCDGCQEEQPVPLSLGSTGWKYRINELYASGYDQGTVTPMIALYRMHQMWGSNFSRSSLAFYPGVEYKATIGAAVPIDRGEIDLVAMRRGQLILVECKESGEHLSNPVEAKELSNQLGNLAVLGEHLNASRIVVATATAFPEDKDSLLDQVSPDWADRIEWWDSSELLDPALPLVGGNDDKDTPDTYLTNVSGIADPLS